MTMTKHIARAVGLLAVLAAPAAAQNPYVRAGAQIGVVADLRARNVGDILTITIQEQHSVKNQEQVQRRNDSSLAARLEAYSLSEDTFKATLPRIDVRKESDFQGESRQNSGSEVRASIAVNDETRTLRISGLVRALDVSPMNTVGSAMVADARISILGEGGGVRQVTRGPVGAMFDTLIWACWPF
jgi:flagellar L-ring protein precursor FlgH